MARIFGREQVHHGKSEEMGDGSRKSRLQVTVKIEEGAAMLRPYKNTKRGEAGGRLRKSAILKLELAVPGQFGPGGVVDSRASFIRECGLGCVSGDLEFGFR